MGNVAPCHARKTCSPAVSPNPSFNNYCNDAPRRGTTGLGVQLSCEARGKGAVVERWALFVVC